MSLSSSKIKDSKKSSTYLSKSKNYHLVSCGGDAILRLFPSRRDKTESGAQWLERKINQLADALGEESPLRQAAEVGLKQIEPERLWTLLNAPETVSKETFYSHASELLVQELGLSPTPKSGYSQTIKPSSMPNMKPSK